MSRAAKQKSVAKLIEIINKLIERQEKLLNHIAELEDYVHALESLNEFEEGEEFISFIPDEEFQRTIEDGLDEKQKAKLEEFKRKKEEETELFSLDEILKELGEDD
tara:strand:+ start:2942 stop:3259 length:318 start_codon:yes stop_codon:yes gene_type:complete